MGVVVFLCSASVAHAQPWPAYVNVPYNQGYQVPAQPYYPAPNKFGAGYSLDGSCPAYRQAPAQQYYYSPGGFGAAYPGVSTPGTTYYAPASKNYYPAYQDRSNLYSTLARNPAPPNPGSPYPYSVPSGPYYSASRAADAAASSPAVEIGTPLVNEPAYTNRAIYSQAAPTVASNSYEDRQFTLNLLWQRMTNAMDRPDDGARAALPFHRPTDEKFWVSADYLALFSRPMRMAGPLLTTGSINDTHPGSLGQPSTTVLFGNRDTNFNLMSGVNLTAGLFLDGQNRFSLDWRGFLTVPNQQTFSLASDPNGNPLLTRPVFATDVGDQRVFLTAFPDQFAGKFTIENKSLIGGTEFNARYHTYNCQRLHAEALLGVRYMRLSEGMRIEDNVNGINGATIPFPPLGGPAFSGFSDQDIFSTTNQFFGAQIGSRLAWENQWFTLAGFAKVGLGATVQRVDIDGSTTFFSPAGNQTVAGGVLAQSSNIGGYSRTVFGVVPEVGLDLGVNVTNHIRLHLGYSALLWNRVVRPGMQVDTNVNTGLAPTGNFGAGNITGPVAPLFRFNDESYWIQNLKLGVELHF
jgi:hypothetical protein